MSTKPIEFWFSVDPELSLFCQRLRQSVISQHARKSRKRKRVSEHQNAASDFFKISG